MLIPFEKTKQMTRDQAHLTQKLAFQCGSYHSIKQLLFLGNVYGTKNTKRNAPDREARSLNRLGAVTSEPTKGQVFAPGPVINGRATGREIWWGLAVDFDFVLGKKRAKCHCSEALRKWEKWSIIAEID
ncbi:hypothetical protein CEXT_609451 [Caerostris extrusa]|uniref:Uncharacterized protein n=1 Tax=Caerostris extrusa TaxID=172846 RepID=A0AAV4V1I4_CAEEX|nr:hypothetical protein CEXT_609451 [Caerostris extrusa]